MELTPLRPITNLGNSICRLCWPPVPNGRLGVRLERYFLERVCPSLGAASATQAPLAPREKGRNTVVQRWELPNQGIVYARGWQYDITRRLAHEHQAVSRLLQEAGLSVPRLLWVDDSFATLRRYRLEVAVEEAAPGSPLPPRPDFLVNPHAILRQLAEAMARLHARRGPHWGKPWRPVNEMNSPQAYWSGRLASLRSWIAGQTRAIRTGQILEMFDCLEAKLQRIAWGRPTLVHGDFSPNHIFVDASSTLTWIDFNTAHFGHPAEDLSAVVKWLNRGELYNHVQYFMAAYREASGCPGDDWNSAIDFFIKMRLVEKLGTRIIKQRNLVEDVKQSARTERLERLAREQDRIEQKLVELMEVA